MVPSYKTRHKTSGRWTVFAEEISVCVAKQATYMSEKATATSRQQGQTLADQWAKAFDTHPKVVMLTWWNEWMAQRQANDVNGNPQFVDEYDSGKSAMSLLSSALAVADSISYSSRVFSRH